MLDQLLPAEIFGFMLVFARIGAAVMLLPGIGESYVFSRVRLGLALALALVIYPLVRADLPTSPAQPLLLMLLIGGEIVHGVVLGSVARLMLAGLHVAGTVIAFQSSLAYAQTVDPNQGSQGALVSAMLTMLGVLLIYVTGTYTVLLAALRDSYTLFPVGSAPPFADYAQLVIQLVSGAFALGLKIAAPFVVYGLVFYIGLGLLQRLIPQVQLFFIAMPAQLMLSFLVLALTMGAGLMVFMSYFENTASHLLAP